MAEIGVYEYVYEYGSAEAEIGVYEYGSAEAEAEIGVYEYRSFIERLGRRP